MTCDLTGRVALVTGTGPNIGQSIATTLALAGARVACNHARAEQAAEAVAAVTAAGGTAIAAPADITDQEQVRQMLAAVSERLGTVDLLVNNASRSIVRPFLDLTLDEWRRVTGVVLDGTFLVTQAVVKRLVAAGRPGAIVNIASTSGHRGRKNALPYLTAKAGILNFTRALAVELAPHGIRVNSVSPTKTGHGVTGLERAAARSFDEIPLGRIGRPEEQANAVLFLCSEQAAFITGEDIRVDGGALATWGTRSHADPVRR